MDEIQIKLRRMVEKEGADVVTLAGMCDLMLKKHLPEHPEAARALALAVERGVAQQIRKTPNAMAREMLIPRWQETLAAGTGLSLDQAQWIIDSWSDAIDAAPDLAAVNPHDPAAQKKKAPPDVDSALLIMLIAGLGFHVLVLVGFSFLIEVFLEPQQAQFSMQQVFGFYAAFLTISAAFSLVPFIALSSMYGHEAVALDRYLRNYFCLWTYGTAAFMFGVLVCCVSNIFIGIFFAIGTLSWLVQVYGFRVFVITSVIHLTQYVIYFVGIFAGIFIVLHHLGIEDPQDVKGLQKRFKEMQEKMNKNRAELKAPAERLQSAWTDRLLQAGAWRPQESISSAHLL